MSKSELKRFAEVQHPEPTGYPTMRRKKKGYWVRAEDALALARENRELKDDLDLIGVAYDCAERDPINAWEIIGEVLGVISPDREVTCSVNSDLPVRKEKG